MRRIDGWLGTQRLAYLNAELAEEVVSKSAKGYQFGVLIKDITAGERDEH
jgi:hypothetical protein